MILTHLSFSISDGDILFIRGPSGVGKSLLLRAVAYLDPIQVGCPVAALSVALRGICCCLLGGRRYLHCGLFALSAVSDLHNIEGKLCHQRRTLMPWLYFCHLRIRCRLKTGA